MLKIYILNIIFVCATFSNVEWAYEVEEFSSEYSSKENSARQIIGLPSVRIEQGRTTLAWQASEESSFSGEFIKVSFQNQIIAEYVYIHESINPGAISSIIIYDESGQKEDTIYKPDSFDFPSETSRIFKWNILDGSKFPVKYLKLNLNTARIPGFNQIDAIGISENEAETNPKIKLIGENDFTAKKQNLGININSYYPELAPIINSEGNKIFYTRNAHPDNIGYEKKQDIWQSKMDSNGKFEPSINLGKPLNNKYANYAISISPDENSLLLGNIYSKDGIPKSGISISYKDSTKWSFPKPLIIKQFDNLGRFKSYFLAPDGQTLLLGYESKNSIGGTDLWVSFLINDSTFSTPKNLGTINTAGNELSPFLAADSKTLYFSSNGYPGYGSQDLYYAKRLDSSWKKWSEPINLGGNINSSGWDAYFTIPASGDYAYFVSTDGSIGGDDIFRIELPENLQPEKVMLISGLVLNGKDNSPVKANIYYERLSDGLQLGIARSNFETGEYKIVLPSGEEYGIRADAEGYYPVNKNLDLRETEFSEKFEMNLTLLPIEKGQKIRINNIFFEFNKFDLLPSSYPELDRLAKLMNDQPSLRISIQGHTDNVGTYQNNLELSNKRAKSVKDYLVSKGIDELRLESIGLGESFPLEKGDSEETHKKNRRVEFEIIEK